MNVLKSERSRRLSSSFAVVSTWIVLAVIQVIRCSPDSALGLVATVWSLVIITMLLLLSTIDAEQLIVPHAMLIPWGAASAAQAIAQHALGERNACRDALVAALVAGGGMLLLAVLVRGALGMGDVKFCAVAGLALGPDGWALAPAAVAVGLVCAGVVAAVELGRGRRGEMPLLPFLAFGIVILLPGDPPG